MVSRKVRIVITVSSILLCLIIIIISFYEAIDKSDTFKFSSLAFLLILLIFNLMRLNHLYDVRESLNKEIRKTIDEHNCLHSNPEECKKAIDKILFIRITELRELQHTKIEKESKK